MIEQILSKMIFSIENDELSADKFGFFIANDEIQINGLAVEGGVLMGLSKEISKTDLEKLIEVSEYITSALKGSLRTL